MTINLSDNSPRVIYTVAAGVTQSSFTVPFDFFEEGDVNVYVDGVLKTITTDYTVSGGSGTGGTVTMSVTGISGGSSVVLTRDLTLERTTDFPTSGPFDVTSLNTELDRFTAMSADLKDQVDRALQLTDYDADANLTLPDLNSRKGKVLAFDATTGDLVNGPSTAGVTTVAAAAADIATLADIQDGTVATNAITDAAAIKTNITTVAGIASNVTTTAGNTTNINTVAGNTANINTVAGIDSDVTTVSGISANVTTAAGISADITAVAADATDIGTVSANIANVNSVAAIDSDVTTVAGMSSADITTVAGISANVTTLAGINADVTTVAGIAADVTAAATNASDISAIAAEVAKVVTVANDLNEATSEIDVVANNIANVNLVGADIANVNTVASNLADVNAFADTYFISATAPSSPTQGDLWFDTDPAALLMKVYDGSGWVNAGSSVNGTSQRVTYTATAGQTSFAATYDAGFVDVYLNGIKLIDGTDFTATSGTSIVLASGAALNDTVDIVAYGTFTLLSTVLDDLSDVSTAGATSGQVLSYNGASWSASTPSVPTLSSLGIDNHDDITVDGSGNVGIGTGSPQRNLQVHKAAADSSFILLTNSTTGSSGSNGLRMGVDGNGYSYIYNGANTHMAFATNNTERLRIDSSGRVGIGTTSPSASIHAYHATANVVGTFESGDADVYITLADNTTTSDTAMRIGVTGNDMHFSTSATERMRIDSNGRLLVSTTTTLASSSSAKLQVYGGTGVGAAFQSDNAGQQTLSVWNKGDSGTRYFVWFESSSGRSAVGSITSNGSSTSYNTTSDYRLKENVVADWDATTRLKQLNPVRFNFIADPDTTVDGFLAHEVQTVVPEAISGTHNGMRDEEYQVSAATGDIYTPAIEAVLDEDGNEVTPAVAEVIHSTDVERPEELAEGQQWRETTAAVMGTRSVPDYQGIDQSKLVPLLVKTIQELEARITALENV